MASSPKQLVKRLAAKLPSRLQSALRRLHYRRKLQRARITDEPDLAVIGLLTKPGDTVLDIGANFGLFTRFLSESVGKEGRVFSFEPTGDMFEVLEGSCSALGLENVGLFRLALSDRSGVSEMVIPVREDGTLNHYEASLAGGTAAPGEAPSGKALRVETCTLDDFCDRNGLERIDFIKCDVEGHEIEVFSGARGTLSRHRPTLLVEVNDPLDSGGHGTKFLELVQELAYEVHTLHDGRLQPWQPGETCVNYVLKPR